MTHSGLPHDWPEPSRGLPQEHGGRGQLRSSGTGQDTSSSPIVTTRRTRPWVSASHSVIDDSGPPYGPYPGKRPATSQ
jgi:hypothetical protein